MRKYTLCVLVFILTASLLPQEAANSSLPPIPVTICGVSTQTVAENLAKFAFPLITPQEVVTLAINDILCDHPMGGEKSHMPNLALGIRHQHGNLYQIFHVHFRSDGTITHITPFFSVKSWRDKNWLGDWCAVTRTLHPQEKEQYGC